MNRIYQGRVARVEIPIQITLPQKGKGKPKIETQWLLFHRDPVRAQHLTRRVPELLEKIESEIAGRAVLSKEERAQRPKSKELQEYELLRAEQREQWHEALWQHHQLFQDAVNYYTVALAAMAEGALDKTGANTAMADFAVQVRDRWNSFAHKGKERTGLRQSLCRTLVLLDDEKATWEVCTKIILDGASKHFPERKDAKGIDVFHRVIEEMFPEKSRGLNPQKMSNSDWPWLCWTSATGETPAKSFYRKNRGIHDFLSELFNANEHGLASLAKKPVADTFLTSIEQTDDESEPSEVAASTHAQADELTKEGADGVEKFTGVEAVNKLRACLITAKKLLTDDTFKMDFALMGGNIGEADAVFERIEKALADKEKECKEKPESLWFQKWNTGGKDKDNLRVELFVLFGFDGGSAFTAALLKARVKKFHLDRLRKTDLAGYVAIVDKYGLCGPIEREHERVNGKEPFKIVADVRVKAKKALSDESFQKTARDKPHADYIQEIRDKNDNIVFPGFTAIRRFATPKEETATDGERKLVFRPWKIGATEWKNFEFAAFEEALKSPNQIKKKTEERTKERKKLEAIEKLYKGRGREKATDEDGEEEGHLPGFKDDDRFGVIEALHKTLAVEDGTEPDKTYEYGFSQAALRGYEELCAEWNKHITPDEPFSEEKAKKLRDEVLKDHQRNHRDDVGAVRLFEELLKKPNWCLWRTPTTTQETWRKANNHSTNILRDYLRYQEVVERIAALNKKVNYTPADASLSRRLFDFKAGAQGGFSHGVDKENGDLWFATQIAVKNAGGKLRKQDVRIHYSAPRLLRDASRVLSEDEKLNEANWMPPIMRALGIEEIAKHDFSKHAVSLMPDWKPGTRSSEPDRMLLNFVLTLKEDDFVGRLRKAIKREIWPWPRQFNVNGDFNDATLRWPHEDWEKAQKWKDFPKTDGKPVKWFEQASLTSFRFVSVDLGQKQAGAYALMEASCCLSGGDRAKARYIGSVGEGMNRRDWYARVLTKGLLKLPGENAEVFRPEYINGKPVKGTGKFREELSGSAGRKATDIESAQTITLLTDLQQLDLLDEDCRDAVTLQKRLMFPDQNAKLLVALRRVQSFAGRLHRWCWFLNTKGERKDHAQRQRTAIKEIAEADPHPWLSASTHEAAKNLYEQVKDKKEAVMPTPDPRIAGTLAKQLDWLMENLPATLEIIANRVYHSRGGHFVWSKHPDKTDCHLLGFKEWNELERKNLRKDELMLAGQRGLSIDRIEQMEELRKRCQSLNQMARRTVGEPPLKSRDDSIPDPCPAILAKLDSIKEQRRNQTAHMILTEALGLRLREPAELTTEAEWELAEAKDQHGEYEKADFKGCPILTDKPNDWRGIIDFIVIEDLSRYRTTQGRAPRENSRLMKWCHRAIRDKLKEMCQPFGIPLVETPAAYSSRFCSRSGVAGFRATELSPSMLNESKWRWRAKKHDDGKEETKEQRERREKWEAVFADVRNINEGRDGITKGKKYRTLLVPDAGGSVFIPISALNEHYQRPAKDSSKPKLARPMVQYVQVNLEMNQCKFPRLIHADINAAVNLGLRAVANPKVWSIHSRLRSEREVGSPIAAKTKKAKRGKKGAPTVNEPFDVPFEEIKPDEFFAKEKRKHGSRAEAKGVKIVILSAERAIAKSTKADDEQVRRHWLEVAQKKTPKASDSRHPNFFADTANFFRTHWGAAKLQPLLPGDTHPAHLVSGKALWGYVKNQEWKHTAAINSARLTDWKRDSQ
jgi:hypothetical protein